MNQHADLIEPLTVRELQILALIGEGRSYAEIGKKLFIEKTTVTWYVQQIYDKLGLEKSQRNHQKALARAQALGLVGAISVASHQEQANPPLKNPYKGLRSFQQGDAGEFFGRETLIQQLLMRLGESDPMARFLAVVGPSGCGKSSVLHAGLIPALRKGGVQGSEHWIIASMIPGSHPLDELEAALARVSDKSSIEILAQLARDERGLHRVCGMLFPENIELLLLIDQFEEIFSLLVDEKQRTSFLELIRNSITHPHSRVRVVIALRADYYDRPLMAPGISELFRLRTEVVTPLTNDELAQAICIPAKQAGVQVEAGLVEAMVNEVSERPGLLPLMQYSLTELFERRQNTKMTLVDYYQIGGIRGSLTRRADVLYESLNVSQQALLRQIFLRLVKIGTEGEVLRRRVRRSELQDLDKNGQVLDELIDKLTQYRLITLDYDPASDCGTVEIAHEALIRKWEQLRDWLDDSRMDIRQQRLLAVAASDWREAKRDSSYLLSGTHLIQFQSWAQESRVNLGPAEREFLTTSVNEKQRHERKRRLIRNLGFSAVVIVAIVMSALAVIALDREQQAQDARTRAERRTLENRSIQLATYAQAAYIEGHTDLALLLAMKSVDMTDPPDLSEQIFRTITQGPGLRAILSTRLNPITSLSISPNNKIVIAGGCGIREPDMTCKQGNLIAINIEDDASTLEKNPQLIYLDNTEFNGVINDVAFNPVDKYDGNLTALSACEDGNIILWDVSSISTAKVIRSYDGHAGSVNDVAFSPDGRQFVSAYDQGMIIFWDTDSGKEIQRLSSAQGDVTSVAFSQNSQMALSASDDGTTILWDVVKKTEIRRYASPAGVWLNRVSFGPADEYGGTTVWGLSSNNAVYVWDLETAKQVSEMAPGSNPYRDIAFTTDGEKVALAFEKMILLRNTGYGSYEQRLLQNSQAIDNSITALEISVDDTLLISGDKEGDIELWNLPVRNDLEVETVGGVTSLGNAVLFPDQQHMLSSTGSADTAPPCLAKIDLLNNSVDECFTQLPNQVAPNGLAIDPAGHYVVVGGGNLEVTDPSTPEEPFLWVVDANSGEIIHRLEAHQHNVKAVAISPDGRYALSGSAIRSIGSTVDRKGELFLWDVQIGDVVRQFTYSNDIQAIDFSHDGKLAVTCSQTETSHNVVIWEIPAGEQVDRFSFGCLDAYFLSNDESIMIDANTETSLYQIVQIDANSGKIQRTFGGLDGIAVNFSLSPDEQYLFAASLTSAALWDMERSEALSNFKLPSPGANTWAVFPVSGNNVIIVQDNSSQLIQWRINTMPTLTNLQIWILKNRYIRPLTCDERELYEILPLCKEAEGEE